MVNVTQVSNSEEPETPLDREEKSKFSESGSSVHGLSQIYEGSHEGSNIETKA